MALKVLGCRDCKFSPWDGGIRRCIHCNTRHPINTKLTAREIAWKQYVISSWAKDQYGDHFSEPFSQCPYFEEMTE